MKIVAQGYRDIGSMYVISKGVCSVSIYDECIETKKMKDQEVRTLTESDYFGEISLIHDSVRTASVTSKNYLTLGKLDLKTLYELASTYPFFKNTLLERMYRYDD